MWGNALSKHGPFTIPSRAATVLLHKLEERQYYVHSNLPPYCTWGLGTWMGVHPTNRHDGESVVVDNPGNYSTNQCQLRDCNIDNEKSRWPFYNLLPQSDMNCDSEYVCVCG